MQNRHRLIDNHSSCLPTYQLTVKPTVPDPPWQTNANTNSITNPNPTAPTPTLVTYKSNQSKVDLVGEQHWNTVGFNKKLFTTITSISLLLQCFK